MKKGWLVAGRMAAGASLTVSVVTFVVNFIKGDEWTVGVAMSIAEALGTLAVPYLTWRLYAWCTERLKVINRTESEVAPPVPNITPLSASPKHWPALAKVLAPGLLVAVVLALLFRYETTGSDRGVVYKRDRWTGDTYFIAGAIEKKVVRQPDGK